LILSVRNNEVQFAGEIQPRGCRYTLEIPSGEQKVGFVQISTPHPQMIIINDRRKRIWSLDEF